jgi:rhodanese-related sulfurtransferase
MLHWVVPDMEKRTSIIRNIFLIGLILFAASYTYNNFLKYKPKKADLNVIFQKMSNPEINLIILDIRKKEEFDKLSLKEAISITFEEIVEAVNSLKKDDTINYKSVFFIFGHNNDNMEEVLLLLREQNIKNILFLNSGFEGFEKETIKSWVD